MVALINKYKVIVFDAHKGDVYEMEWDGELHQLYDVMKCDLVDTIRLSRDHIFFVDDEGMLKEDQPGGFRVNYKKREVNFIGTGVLVGDCHGESRSVSLDVEKLEIHYFSYEKGKERA
jgi:hypothetical protein